MVKLMNKMTEKEINAAFSYEVFDRQLVNFHRMMYVLMEGWEDYGSQEMTFDICSLCTKASRLCYMADQDLALQHTDIIQQRKEQNERHLDSINMLMSKEFTPFLSSVVQAARAGRKVEGHKSPMFVSEVSVILPKLSDLLSQDGMTHEEMIAFNADLMEVEREFMKKVKMTKFPGVRQEERLWNLLRLYTLTCYLLLHFRRVCYVSNQSLGAEEMGRLMELAVLKYMNEEPGKQEIELYFSNLRYDNDGNPLGEGQLLSARRKLKEQVPKNLLLAFLNHADDARQLGAQLSEISFTADEFLPFLDATAKYQLITQKLFELQHSEEAEETLHNQVFYSVVNNRPVDMEELRKSIAKMVTLVTKKNQWFCVWSVLKHHNLIRVDTNFSAFANQMMSEDWFGDIDTRLRFSGDNLSDYSRYFSEYDYTQWDKEMFLEKKKIFGMKKWSESLFDTFSTLCRDMEKSICGHQFLG